MTVGLVVAVGLLGAVVGFAPLRSYDYWWHLRTGQQIVETRSVPRVDPYTYSVPGARWIDMHWTFQVGLYGLYAFRGHQAVRLAKGVCVLALLLVLGKIGWRRSRPWVSAFALGGALIGASDRLFERPELLSFLLLATQLALLYRQRRSDDRWVYAIVPLQLLWANLHGLFAIGIAVCVMALLAELARPWLRSGAALRRRHARDLALVTVASLLVSFVNPNGADAVLFPLEQLGMIGLAGTQSDLGSSIAELRPTLGVPGGLGRLVASGGLALVAMALNRRRLAPFDGLVYVAFSCLALAAERNVALLAIASVPIAVRNLNAFIDAHALPARADAVAGALAIVLLTFASVGEVRSQGFLWTPAPLQEGRFPEAAVDWIASQRPEGPIFHAMGDGGYLIWRLHPDYPVMVDGRLEVFGAERYAQLRVRSSGRPEGFRRVDEQYRFGVALLHHRFFPALHLLRWLDRSPEWRLVQLDEVAAVFVRVGTASPAWPEVGANGLAMLPPLEEAARSNRDLRRRAARFAILEALDRHDQAAALFEATCARYAGRGTAPFPCGAGASAPRRGGGRDSAE